jgi:glycosyltransferase involved in cell wall biosynthesis
MRIAYISADRGVPICGCSGSAVHVAELIRCLAQRGHEITLFSATAAPDPAGAGLLASVVDLCTDVFLNDLRLRLAKSLRAAGHQGIEASELYSLLLNQTLLAALSQAEERFDLVYERQSLWSFAGLQWARQHGVPYFLEVNAPLVQQQEAYRQLGLAEAARAIEALLLSSADRVLVTTGELQTYCRARGAAARRLRVVPCGVPATWFRRSTRLGCRNDGTFVVGFVGSLKPWHGVEVLLEVFLQLSRISPVYRLLVVGDGPLLAQIDSFQRQHALASRVTLAGAVAHDRVPELLAQIDVGLAPYPPLPSFYFSPLKVWEYAAAGVPIVASASGPLPQQFPHRLAALLHPPGNVRKIVKHVELLRHHPELAVRLARRARRVAKLHTWDRIAARVETLADQCIAAVRVRNSR